MKIYDKNRNHMEIQGFRMNSDDKWCQQIDGSNIVESKFITKKYHSCFLALVDHLQIAPFC